MLLGLLKGNGVDMFLTAMDSVTLGLHKRGAA